MEKGRRETSPRAWALVDGYLIAGSRRAGLLQGCRRGPPSRAGALGSGDPRAEGPKGSHPMTPIY